MSRLLTSLCAIGCVTLAGAAAAGPRPGPAVHEAPVLPALYRSDASLEKHVTLRMARSPLSAVAAELQRQTRVRLAAVGIAAEEPAIVFVHDRPLKEVMFHLAQLFDYRWTRRPAEGGWRYELAQDRESKAREQALREADVAGRMEHLQRDLRLCTRLAGESPDAVKREYDPLWKESRAALDRARTLSGEDREAVFASLEYQKALETDRDLGLYREMQLPVPRALAKFAGSLSAEQWRALQEGDVLRFSTRPDQSGAPPLPPALAQELQSAQPEMLPLFWFPGGPDLQADYLASLREQKHQAQEAWTHAAGLRLSVRLDPILALESSGRRVWPQLWMRADPEGGASLGLSGNFLALEEDLWQVEWAPVGVSYPDHVPAAWKEDPVLGANRALKIEFPTDPWAKRDRFAKPAVHLRDILPVIAETYGINLVADAYWEEGSGNEEPFFGPLPRGAEWPLYRALNRFVMPVSRWTKEGDFIHVR